MLGEARAKVASCVVQGLVESAAGCVQAIGEYVDRHTIHRQSNENTPLVGGQDLCDRFLKRRQKLALLGLGVRLEVDASNTPQPSGSSGTSRPCQARFRSFTAASSRANL